MSVSTARVVLLGAAMALAGATIWSDLARRRRTAGALKALTMVYIIAAAAWETSPKPAYRMLVVAGLCCSLVGDVLLELEDERFVQGLAAFLVAHLIYIAAFTIESTSFGPLWPLIPLGLVFLAMTRMLGPHLGTMRLPVIVYEVVILAMTWRAWVRWDVLRSADALAGGIGAWLFVASDAALAYDRFVRRLPMASLTVLLPYFAAQALIALSV